MVVDQKHGEGRFRTVANLQRVSKGVLFGGSLEVWVDDLNTRERKGRRRKERARAMEVNAVVVATVKEEPKHHVRCR